MNAFAQGLAVITGGGSGIGAALAKEVAKRGARVAVADIKLDAAQAVAAEIGDQARAFQVDVTETASMEKLAADVAAEMGGVTLLFSNAGVGSGGGLHETSAEDFAWMFDVNVTGFYRAVRAFAPAILEQAKLGRHAHIIVTGSENSFSVPPGIPHTVYTGTKHALLGLADGLRRDIGEQGVGVSILCPGTVPTNLAASGTTRHDRYGGAFEIPQEQLDGIIEYMRGMGRTADETAVLSCEGIERGDFMIVTDPKLRAMAEPRLKDMNDAFDTIDARLGAA